MKNTLVVIQALLVAGCGATPVAAHDAGLAVDSGQMTQNDAGSTGDGGVVAPGTPILVAATLVVHGTMQLTWQLPDSGCSEIQLLMKLGTGNYSAVKTVAGAATSTQQMAGHGNGTYCFQVTCSLSGLPSVPSNEKCVTQ